MNENNSNPSLPSGRFFIYINMDRQKRRKPKVKLTKTNHKLAKAISASMPAIPAGQHIRSLAYFIYIKKVTTRPGSGRMPIACQWFVLWLPLGCQVSGVWLPIGRRMDVFCLSLGCPPFGRRLVANWLPAGSQIDSRLPYRL